MPAPVQSKLIYRFGVYEADLARGALLRKGEPVRLQDQPFRLLTILLERAGEIVSREEIRQKLWPADTYVAFDGSLNAALKRLRFALGDSADNPTFIETIPKRGYRFVAPVSSTSSGRSEEAIAVVPASATQPRSRWLWLAVPAIVALMAIAWTALHKPPVVASAVPRVVAVLPFANEGAGPEFDYLRYAIANELVTDLSQIRLLNVRPFASTSRYDSTNDPAAVGRELHVTHVLTGGYLLDQENLHVNLELVDVARNAPVWRDDVSVPRDHFVGLSRQLASHTTQGMLPALHVASTSIPTVPEATNERAFMLYLHSVSISHDLAPNKIAIKNLEEAAALDDGYWPIYDELAWRYYIDYTYGDGGEEERSKGIAAEKKLTAADPNGTGNTITLRSENGDLAAAYEEASSLLRRRSDSSTSHFEMSYLLRYAGLLGEAGEECEKAIAIDPGFSNLRSCAIPFILKGDYERARKFERLDENTAFAAMLRTQIALRNNDEKVAVDNASLAARGGLSFCNLIALRLAHSPEAEVRQAAADLEKEPKALHDSEVHYRGAIALSFAGFPDAGLRELHRAVNGHYCSYPAMDLDPMLAPVRALPEYSAVRQQAIACQNDFLAARSRIDLANASGANAH